MRSAVVTIYRERRALDRSLRGFSQSLGKLDTFFYVITGLATLIVVLPVWGIPLTAILPFVSLLIALSFIFGGSVKSMFDSLIFIFVFHPYDTGESLLLLCIPHVRLTSLTQKAIAYRWTRSPTLSTVSLY